VEKSFVYREGREIRIGRKKADITVTHPAVSSEHLLLVMRESGITFWNKGKNGTYINGLRVESGELQEGKYRLLLAGKQPVSVSVVRERAAESFYKGSLSPLFEQVEGWLQKTELFGSHPIILFTGESGVGKEVFADFAHGMSGRKGEFVTYNAAAIPETLVESELFGTCKGSFTGAEERSGAFLRANGGTLFLDEIAEMPLSLQSKLLRVTEDWTIRRIGETGAGKRVDVMLVLATNRDLEQEVAAGRFRKDLFYRLSTLSLNIPPLRQRRGDIVPLARHLLFSLIGRELPISDDAAAALSAAEWPGNVRELKSMMTRFAYTGKERVDLSAIK
jgi:DNA-binding NtrC family response regulator